MAPASPPAAPPASTPSALGLQIEHPGPDLDMDGYPDGYQYNAITDNGDIDWDAWHALQDLVYYYGYLEDQGLLPSYITYFGDFDSGPFINSSVRLDTNGDPLDGGQGAPWVFTSPFLPEGATFAGVIDTFEFTHPDGSPAAPEEFFAQVFWGDGSISNAEVVAGAEGQFDVRGSHTWQVDGVYLSVVRVVGPWPSGEPGAEPFVHVDATPVFVLQLGDPGAIQAIPRDKVTVEGDRSLSTSVAAEATADRVSVTGSASYKLTYDTHERHQTVSRTVTGSVTFSTLETTGAFLDPFGDFALATQRVATDQGSVVTDWTAQYAGLDENYSRTASDTYSWSLIDKQLDFAAGTYTLAEAGTHTAGWRDEGEAINLRAQNRGADESALPQGARAVVGQLTREATQSDSFSRTETGDVGSGLEGRYDRTDTHRVSTNWQQTGTTGSSQTYTLVNTAESVLDTRTESGNFAGESTHTVSWQYDTPDGTTDLRLSLATPQPNGSPPTTLTLDERETLTRTRTVTLSPQESSATLTGTDSHTTTLTATGPYAGQTWDGEQVTRQEDQSYTYTADRTAGSYQLIGSDAQPSEAESEGDDFFWERTETGRTSTETGNFVSKSFTLTEQNDLTVQSDVRIQSSGQATPGLVTLATGGVETFTASGQYGSKIEGVQGEQYKDATLKTEGLSINPAAVSANDWVSAFVNTAVSGTGAIVGLFKSALRTEDGIPLPASGNAEIKFDTPTWRQVVGVDVLGNVYYVGLRAGAVASIAAGINVPVLDGGEVSVPYYAVIGDFQGAVTLFGGVVLTVVGGGTMLQVEASAQFHHHREIHNPQSLDQLGRIVPDDLVAGIQDIGAILGLIDNKLSAVEVRNPSTSLDGATTANPVEDANNLTQFNTSVPTGELSAITSRIMGFQVPGLPTFASALGVDPASLPPLPTVSDERLPYVVSSQSQLSFGLKIRLTHVLPELYSFFSQKVDLPVDVQFYLDGGVEYRPIDRSDRTVTWYDDAGQVAQTQTTNRSSSGWYALIDARAGVTTNPTHNALRRGGEEGAIAMVGASYSDILLGTTVPYTTTITEVNQTRTVTTVETGTITEQQSLRVFGVLAGNVTSYEQQKSKSTATQTVTRTNSAEPTFQHVRSATVTADSMTSEAKLFGAITGRDTKEHRVVVYTEADDNQDRQVRVTGTTTADHKSTYTTTGPAGPYHETATDVTSDSRTVTTSNRESSSTFAEQETITVGTAKNGEQFVGGYTATLTTVETSSRTGTEENRGRTVSVLESGSTQRAVTGRTGHMPSGLYALTLLEASTRDTSLTQVEVNHDLTVTTTQTDQATTVTLSERGNDRTGRYTLYETATGSSATDERRTNRVDYSATSEQDRSTAVTTWDAGNEVVGRYTLTAVETGSGGEDRTEQVSGWELDSHVTTDTFSTSLTEVGNEPTGSYSLTQSEQWTLVEQTTETNRGSETTVTATTTHAELATDTGNTVSGGYTLTATTTLTSAAVQTGSNQTVAHVSGNSTRQVQTTAAETGNDVTGSYTLTTTETATNSDDRTEENNGRVVETTASDTTTTTTIDRGSEVTGEYTLTSDADRYSTTTLTETNRSVTTTVTTTENGGSTEQESGNFVVGHYTLTITQTDSSTADRTESNQTFQSTGRTVVDQTVTTIETGNDVTGDYTLTATETATTTMSGSEENQTLRATVTADAMATTTTTETGNVVTGGYTLTEDRSERSLTTRTEFNRETLTTTLVAAPSSTSTTTEFGNEITGEYTLTATETFTLTEARTEENQGAYDAADTTSTASTTTTETGNEITGDYTLSETSDRTWEGIRTEENRDSFATIEETGEESTTVDETGSVIGGEYTLTVSESSDRTEVRTEENRTHAATATIGTESTVDRTEDGDQITGDYTLTVTETLTLTEFRSEDNWTFHADADTTASTTTTTTETGNELTGSYTLTVAETRDSDTTRLERNGDSYHATVTLTDSATENATGDGNSVTGESDRTVTTTTSQTEDRNEETRQLRFVSAYTTVDSTATTTETGNEVTGSYTLTSHEDTARTEALSEENQTYTSGRDRTVTLTSDTTDTGDRVTGDYTLTGTVVEVAVATRDDDNQNEHFDQTVTESTSTSLRETGSEVTGGYTLTDRSTERVWEDSVRRNGEDLSVTVTLDASDTATTTETGNWVTGEYVLTVDAAGGQERREDTRNHSLTVTTTETGATGRREDGTGNRVTGDRTVTLSPSSTLVEVQHSVNPPLDVQLTQTLWTSGTLTTVENAFNGFTSTKGFEGQTAERTETRTNQGLVVTVRARDTDRTDTDSTGDLIAGTSTATLTESDTTDSTRVETNQNLTVTLTERGLSGERRLVESDAITGDATVTERSFSSTLTAVEQSTQGLKTVGRTDTVTTTGTGDSSENTILGDYTLFEESTAVTDRTQHDVNRSLVIDSRGTTTLSLTISEHGNRNFGDYTLHETADTFGTDRQTGQNGRWDSTTDLTSTASRVSDETGNRITGAQDLRTDRHRSTVTSVEHDALAGSSTDGADKTATTTEVLTTSRSGDLLSGTYTLTTVERSVESTGRETGTRGGLDDYTLTWGETVVQPAPTTKTGNDLTGEHTGLTVENYDRWEVRTFGGGVETKYDVAGGARSVSRSGNAVTGDYTLTETHSGEFTRVQTGSGIGQLRTASEAGDFVWVASEAGNEVAGWYEGKRTGSEGMNTTLVTADGLMVTQGTERKNVTTDYSGELVSGDATSSETATLTYRTTETRPLTPTTARVSEVNGALGYVREQTADSATGQSGVTLTGTDNYTYQVGDPLTTVAMRGAESVLLSDNSNAVTGEFVRAVSGVGGYNLLDPDGKPIEPGGATTYTFTETGNPQTGRLTQTGGGDTRYTVLGGWEDASQSGGLNGRGAVENTPFGPAFGLRQGGGPGLGADGGSGSTSVAVGVGRQGRYLAGAGLAEGRTGAERTGSAALEQYAVRGAALYLQYCFAAGTPLLTPDGARAIEEFKAGDVVLSRDENDPAGPVKPKVVEEVFVRHGLVVTLRAGGREIRTTAEHPFYAAGRGWQPACLLKPGDRLLGHDGTTVGVDAVVETATRETVYNLRVAGYHTYFVGCPEWGFSAWAHNTYGSDPQGAREGVDNRVPEKYQEGVIRAFELHLNRLPEPSYNRSGRQRQVAIGESGVVRESGWAENWSDVRGVMENAREGEEYGNGFTFPASPDGWDREGYPGSAAASHAEPLVSLYDNVMATGPRNTCGICQGYFGAISTSPPDVGTGGRVFYIADSPSTVRIFDEGQMHLVTVNNGEVTYQPNVPYRR